MSAAPAPEVQTVNEALRRAAREAHGIRFLDAAEHETFLNWAEILRRAEAAAAHLCARGVRGGDRVALILPTSPGFLDAFFGALIAGAVPVPLYPPVRLGRLEEYHRQTARMLQRARVAAVVSDARVRLLLGQAVAAARPPLGLLSVEDFANHVGGGDWIDPQPTDLALIQFSSGSTVDPKPVALEHRHLMGQCAILKALMPESAANGGLGVSWLPLYHDMGLIGALLSAAYYPGPLVLIPPEVFLARPAIWLRAVSRFRATISPAPNFAYALCLKRIKDRDLETLDLSTWRYALNGAEPISADVMRRFAERFSPAGFRASALMPVYGLSEASLAVTFAPPRWPAKTAQVDAAELATSGRALPGTFELVSVGQPVPGVEVQIRDDQQRECPERRSGRIYVRGSSVMRGYFEDASATSAVVQDGWLDTGDLGFIDGGELYVCGRAKDLVIIRGANHAPQQFESSLEQVAGVRPGCVVALGFVPPGATSEELLILAERRGSPDQDAAVEEEIRGTLVERTGIRPHTVLLLEPGTLPRTSSGKMRRSEALRRYVARELHPPLAMNPLRLAAEVARSTLALFRSKVSGVVG